MAEENIGEERGGIKSDTKVHQSQSDDMMGDHLYVCRYSAVHTKQSHSHKCRNEKKDYHYSKYKIPSMTSLHYKNFVIFSRHGHFSKRTHTTSRIQICVKWLFQFHIAFKEKNDNFLRRQDNSDAQEKIAHVAPIFVDCIPSRTIKQRPMKKKYSASKPSKRMYCTLHIILRNDAPNDVWNPGTRLMIVRQIPHPFYGTEFAKGSICAN